MKKIKLSKIEIDLINVCKNKGLKDWHDIREYAYQFKKYDNLTLRSLDIVADIVK